MLHTILTGKPLYHKKKLDTLICLHVSCPLKMTIEVGTIIIKHVIILRDHQDLWLNRSCRLQPWTAKMWNGTERRKDGRKYKKIVTNFLIQEQKNQFKEWKKIILQLWFSISLLYCTMITGDPSCRFGFMTALSDHMTDLHDRRHPAGG